jgi:hypothetical protein
MGWVVCVPVGSWLLGAVCAKWIKEGRGAESEVVVVVGGWKERKKKVEKQAGRSAGGSFFQVGSQPRTKGWPHFTFFGRIK